MKAGLVLSGGGARGIAHLGVIQALEELGITFSAISGSSIGAMIALLYAYGYSPEEILNIFKEVKAFRLLQPALSWKGILKMDVIRRFLEKHVTANDFQQLKLPIYIAATNLRTGQTDYFSEGDVIGAACASSCIPVIFDPVEYNGQLYIDGGILNNLPLEPISKSCDIVIASHCNPIDKDFSARNARQVMERALMLAISCNVYHRKKYCDCFIEPFGLETHRVLDLKNIEAMYQIGYEQAAIQIEKSGILNRKN